MSAKIVVAGGAGFIGRSVTAELLAAGFDVRLVDNAPTASCDQEVQLLRADLRDPAATREALANSEICILLAARSAGIGYFNTHPAEMLDDNCRIVSSVFSAANELGLKRVIYVSSSCIFDNSPAYPITEESLLTSPPPNTGYPFSKLVGEFYCKAFEQQFGLRFTIVRPFNVYGSGELPGKQPGDSHVIPDLALKLHSGQDPLEIFGDGQQTRSFTHVTDVAHGIILAMQNENAVNTDFNLGHSEEVSILRLAEMMWYKSGRKTPFSYRSIHGYPIDVRRRAVDADKAQRLLGWQPKISLEDGVSAYLSWFSTRQ